MNGRNQEEVSNLPLKAARIFILILLEEDDGLKVSVYILPMYGHLKAITKNFICNVLI